ncbi:MAG: HupE/UreJ family protein [Bacteroidota bacterium]|nr:HupE/UreJ family protein [Bacteroidota bacterium]
MFGIYFQLGLEHILDKDGYDHILFIIVLCVSFSLQDWKQVLLLITAFTIGHSLTLALSTFEIVRIKSEVIEFLIPVTILITAVINVSKFNNNKAQSYWLGYVSALFFGLIHGLGFSNYLKAILGRGSSILKQLVAFNLGIEAGQIIVVLVFLCLSYLFIIKLKVNKIYWKLSISFAIALISIFMIFENKIW